MYAAAGTTEFNIVLHARLRSPGTIFDRGFLKHVEHTSRVYQSMNKFLGKQKRTFLFLADHCSLGRHCAWFSSATASTGMIT